MPFTCENQLEKALVEAVKNPASAPDFYRLLLESDLLVIGSVEGQEDAREQITLKPGVELKLVPGQKDGVKFLPVFSSLARMQEYVQQERKFLNINGRALLDLTRGAPVILNPASEYGKELTADQVRQLLDGPRSETRLTVGTKEHPTALVKLLTGVLANRPDVERAWMIPAAFADRPNESRALIGLQLDASGDWPSLMRVIQDAMEKAGDRTVLEMVRVDPHDPTAPSSKLLTAPAFYQRRPVLN